MKFRMNASNFQLFLLSSEDSRRWSLGAGPNSSRAEDCLRIVAEMVGRFGGVDILVNNDGAPPLGSFTDFNDHAWSRAVDQNPMSVVRCIQAAAPRMKARGAGSVVNITALSAASGGRRSERASVYSGETVSSPRRTFFQMTFAYSESRSSGACSSSRWASRSRASSDSVSERTT